MAVTKADLIEEIYEHVGFSKRDSTELVELVFESIKDVLAAGEDIKLSGFGTFKVRQKKSRTGRNPQTGQELEITARKVVSFKSSQVLKNLLNNNS